MIKIAANLERLYGERTRTKQALIGTAISALIHGAAADDDEPMFREILRGAGKGLGADIGMALGGLTGASLGAYTGAKTHGFDGIDPTQAGSAEEAKAMMRHNMDEATGAGGSALLGLGGGGLLGAGAGSVGGYLLADAMIDSIGKKKQKSKNPGVKSAYAPPVSSGNDIRWMAGGRPVSNFSELRGDQPYLQAGNTPATSLDPGNQMAQDRIDYLRPLAPNDPELTNMDPAELASMFNTTLGFGQQAGQGAIRNSTTPAPGIASGASGAAGHLKNRFMQQNPKPKSS
jgi:hypothetical protein